MSVCPSVFLVESISDWCLFESLTSDPERANRVNDNVLNNHSFPFFHSNLKRENFDRRQVALCNLSRLNEQLFFLFSFRLSVFPICTCFNIHSGSIYIQMRPRKADFKRNLLACNNKLFSIVSLNSSREDPNQLYTIWNLIYLFKHVSYSRKWNLLIKYPFGSKVSEKNIFVSSDAKIQLRKNLIVYLINLLG